MESRALGKGLSALIPDKANIKKAESPAVINPEKIQFNSMQPRKLYDDDKLSELISSIKEKGVLQPLLVREKDGGYEVVAGERRLRAARALKMDEVPVIIKEVSDQEALVLALVENIQREELNPIEEAQAFKKLLEEFNFTQESIATSVGKDRSTITNILRLLRLPIAVQEKVEKGVLSEGHARALLMIEGEQEQATFCEQIIQKNLSVRQVEELIRAGLGKTARRKKTKTTAKDYNVVVLEEGLQKALGTKVQIQAGRKRGKIIIEYYSNEDLDRIIDIIKK